MDMTIQCPSCRAALRVPEQVAGRAVRCKTCKATFRVPSPAAMLEDTVADWLVDHDDEDDDTEGETSTAAPSAPPTQPAAAPPEPPRQPVAAPVVSQPKRAVPPPPPPQPQPSPAAEPAPPPQYPPPAPGEMLKAYDSIKLMGGPFDGDVMVVTTPTAPIHIHLGMKDSGYKFTYMLTESKKGKAYLFVDPGSDERHV